MNNKQNKQIDEEFCVYSQRNRNNGRKNVITGSWKIHQNQKFYDFIRKHKKIFLSESIRRSERSFSQIASKLKFRSAEQCRSHFQKFQVKGDNDIDHILKRIEERIKIQVDKIQNKDTRGTSKKTKRMPKTCETYDLMIAQQKNEFYEVHQDNGYNFLIKFETMCLDQW